MEDEDLEIENAMVRRAQLRRNRGCLECFIQLDYGGSAQGFSSPIIANENSGSEKGSEKLLELLDFFGVDRLREIEGRSVRVASKGFNQRVKKLIAFLDNNKTFEWEADKW